MNWNDEVIEKLAAAAKLPTGGAWNYQFDGPSFTEPAALTAFALVGADRCEAALPIARWLAKLQQPDGTVGISATESTPKWPTALAISVWSCWQSASADNQFETNIQAALRWATRHHGVTFPRSDIYGHDTTLRGWPWAMGTHAWLEPTCMFLLAMNHCGESLHVRAAEGVRIVKDRQLPTGGFNYGNTLVLGQLLRAHPQPTGMALIALANARVAKPAVTKSIDFLKTEWPHLRGTSSFCYAALGLAAYDELPADFESRLKTFWERWRANRKRLESDGTKAGQGKSGIYTLALIALAMQKSRCLLLPEFIGV